MWLFDLLGEVWDALASIDDGADPKPRIATCELYVDKVNMRTHKFERSIIEGKVKYNARSMDRPDDDDIIYTAKEEHFGDRDRYIRPYSKNIRTFAAYNNNNNVDSYSYILYDRYENTVIGLCLKK